MWSEEKISQQLKKNEATIWFNAQDTFYFQYLKGGYLLETGQ